MPEPGVDVVWGALSRAWRKVGCTELWVLFRPRGSKDVLDAVLDAAQVANEVVEDAGWGDDVHTGGISESDAGPVVLLRRAEHEPGLRTWLGAFAHHLQSLGKAGMVTAAPYANFPSWFTGALRPSMQLTAFVSYQTNDLSQLEEHERRGVWHVPVALTEKVTDVAADVYPGGCCYQVMDDTMSWQDRLERVTAAMVAFPEDTDLAFVRHSSFRTFTWSALQTGRPPLPFVEEHQVRYNKHLICRYTPDAHGIQILTDAHVAHATDLSDWVIEPLGGGRHLVQARDLEPWYSTIDPDPETLVKARADFGKMILTPQTIADNPPPWH